MNKERASRNRTITLTDDERKELKQQITSAQSFDATQVEDTIICADLLDIIE